MLKTEQLYNKFIIIETNFRLFETDVKDSLFSLVFPFEAVLSFDFRFSPTKIV